MVSKKRLNKEQIFFMVLTLVYPVRIMIYGADSVISVLAVLISYLTTMLFISSADKNITGRIFPGAARAVFVKPFVSFPALVMSFSVIGNKKKDDGTGTNKIVYILIGLCVSIPILIIVVNLLLPDSFFNAFFEGFSAMINKINFFDYLNPISVFVAFYCFGALYSAERGTEDRKNAPWLRGTVISTVMILLSCVYVMFVIAQVLGFSSLFSKGLPDAMTYAGYARSGFFEMCIVAGINGVVMYCANAFVPETEKSFVRLISRILTVLTLLLILTAAIKMTLYVNEYGFTPKRFYTMWAMLLLTIIFSLSFKKFSDEDFNMSAICVYITSAMLAVLFFVDFEWISFLLNN